MAYIAVAKLPRQSPIVQRPIERRAASGKAGNCQPHLRHRLLRQQLEAQIDLQDEFQLEMRVTEPTGVLVRSSGMDKRRE